MTGLFRRLFGITALFLIVGATPPRHPIAGLPRDPVTRRHHGANLSTTTA
jgi:hypothetical protein